MRLKQVTLRLLHSCNRCR